MNIIYETIMRRLLAAGGSTRKEIAAQTRLSPVTVHRYLQRMLKNGSIQRSGEIRPRTGRPAEIYRAVTAARDLPVMYVSPAGVISGVYCPGKGLSHRKSTALPASLDRKKTLAVIRREGLALMKRTDALPAIATTGYVDSPADVHMFIEQGWDTPADLASLFPNGDALYVENDAFAACWGEQVEGVARGEKDYLYINYSRGVGLAAVMGGSINRGATGRASDLENVVIDPAGPVGAAGVRGTLGAYIAPAVIEAQVSQAVKNGTRSSLNHKSTIAEILTAAARGDALAEGIVRTIGEKLGEVLVTLCGLFDPSLIVLGGHLPLAEKVVRKGIEISWKRRPPHFGTYTPRIAASALGEDGILMGVGDLLFKRSLDSTA
jgi:predicted NBD/HSP70 family sugar kinase